MLGRAGEVKAGLYFIQITTIATKSQEIRKYRTLFVIYDYICYS